MTLKNRFDNYTQQPDPKIWDSIEQTLKHHAAVRRGIIIGASVTVLAVVTTLAILLPQRSTQIQQPLLQQKIVEQLANNNTTTPVDTTLNNTDLSTTTAPTKTSTTPQQRPTETNTTPTSVVHTSIATPIVPTAKSTQTHTPQPTLTATSITAQPAISTVTAPKNTNTNSTPSATTAIASNSSKFDTSHDTNHFVIVVPNAFSPNDPNTEEVRTFKARAMEGSNILSFKMYIYSRTGNIVFQSNDINQGWDGSYKGHPQPMGTYVYVIEYKDFQQGLKRTRGTITLIR